MGLFEEAETRAQPVATANGPKRPWLISNVRQRKMSVNLIDRKKLAVGWILIGLAVLTAIFCYVRDARQGIWGCFSVAVIGWTFVGGAKPKKEAVPPKRAYLYLVVLVVLTFAVGIFAAHYFR